MKIWITKPAGADTVLRQRLHARWASVAPNAPAELSFIEAPPFTTHGELLTHIWDRILSDDDPHHVISELDFVPYDTFTETISNTPEGDPQMTFDYKLRPGLATSTNALRLMELVGL